MPNFILSSESMRKKFSVTIKALLLNSDNIHLFKVFLPRIPSGLAAQVLVAVRLHVRLVVCRGYPPSQVQAHDHGQGILGQG